MQVCFFLGILGGAGFATWVNHKRDSDDQADLLLGDQAANDGELFSNGSSNILDIVNYISALSTYH